MVVIALFGDEAEKSALSTHCCFYKWRPTWPERLSGRDGAGRQHHQETLGKLGGALPKQIPFLSGTVGEMVCSPVCGVLDPRIL